MINVKEQIAALLSEHIEGMEAEELEKLIEIPTDTSLGDYAFPCFKLAKLMRKAPNLIASDISGAIASDPMFEKVQPVNAYVNMFMKKGDMALSTLNAVIAKKEKYGSMDQGEGKKVIVEFSSPNIAKPFHIGHIRTTVIGNALANIYSFLGYDVVKINHLGDYGTQFGKMIVAYRHWGSKEEVEANPIKTLLAYYVKFHDEAETHPELEEEARIAFYNLEHGEKEELQLWQWIRDESLKEFSRVYDMLGITFDSYAGESFYSDKMPAVIDELKEKGLLVESRGAQIVDLEKYGMPPAIITKSDGTSIYLTRDLAAAFYRKKTYDFDKCIYVVASQQDLHFQQLFKVIELMGYEWAKDMIHVNFGMVSLADGTLSTRHGRVVFLEDVLNKAVEKTREIITEKGVNTDQLEETAKVVGIGAVVFRELSAGRIKDYVFDWDKVLNFDGETGPYVQYTHARAASVLRNGGFDISKIDMSKLDCSYLTGDAASTLIKGIYAFPEAVAKAADDNEPSTVTRCIIDIAQSFNKFYHDEHIIVDDENERNAKLVLTFVAKQVIANGLSLLGIKAPDRM
ncbi:MAG: arginine--tRNA ligase [Firmicutes bacterium]|nr:arginine--tRNA ligase [Bacillota bacterium]